MDHWNKAHKEQQQKYRTGMENYLHADYDYHHAMAQHAAVVSAASSGQLHPAMAQLPMLPTGLNLSMSSAANQMAAAVSGLPMGSLSNSAAAAAAASLHHHHHHQGAGAGMLQGAHQQGGGHHHHTHGVGVGGGGGNPYMGHMGAGGKLKHKKPKVNKDGVPAPKRATTAYITFTQWYREEMKKSGRQIPRIGDFGKECAGKWNTMSDEDKQPFLSAAARDRERYKREMAVYKPARDVNKPKRPGTAFMLFMADFRKEMAGKEPEGGVAALAKLGGERWRSMTEEDKRPYVERQNEEKMKYEQNMEEYRRKTPSDPCGSSWVDTKTWELIQKMRMKNAQTAESQAAKLQQQQEEQQQQQQQQQQRQQQSNAPNHDSVDSDSGDTFHGNQSHSNPPSGGSTPSPGGGGGATTHSEHTDESQGATPSSSSQQQGGGGGGPLPSLGSPLSLPHPLASLGYQHSLASFGITSGGFGSSAHNAASTAASHYLPGSPATYSQAHLPGPYSWT
ncbi:high mobility group protein DSP1-like isoform X2 [Ornithodoros turicata]